MPLLDRAKSAATLLAGKTAGYFSEVFKTEFQMEAFALFGKETASRRFYHWMSGWGSYKLIVLGFTFLYRIAPTLSFYHWFRNVPKEREPATEEEAKQCLDKYIKTTSEMNSFELLYIASTLVSLIYHAAYPLPSEKERNLDRAHAIYMLTHLIGHIFQCYWHANQSDLKKVLADSRKIANQVDTII